MFRLAIQNTNIEKIYHKFMDPGHSHVGVDTDIDMVEKNNKKLIYTFIMIGYSFIQIKPNFFKQP